MISEEFPIYVVLCCGCTDCFPHAAFLGKLDAEHWAHGNCRNPEGYIIKRCTSVGEFLSIWRHD